MLTALYPGDTDAGVRLMDRSASNSETHGPQQWMAAVCAYDSDQWWARKRRMLSVAEFSVSCKAMDSFALKQGDEKHGGIKALCSLLHTAACKCQCSVLRTRQHSLVFVGGQVLTRCRAVTATVLWGFNGFFQQDVIICTFPNSLQWPLFRLLFRREPWRGGFEPPAPPPEGYSAKSPLCRSAR